VLLLAQAFVDRFAAQNGKGVKGISAPAAERLLTYDWPGNIRELQNCIERAVALTLYDHISEDDLPEKIREYRPTRLILDAQNPDELPPMEEVERRYIRKVLESVGGNKTMAASVLGFDRRTLYRKLQRTGTRGDGEREENAASPAREPYGQ
jgi:two-component system response regulator HydG